MNILADLVGYIETNLRKVTLLSGIEAYVVPSDEPILVEYYIHNNTDFKECRAVNIQYGDDGSGLTPRVIHLNKKSRFEIKDDMLIVNKFMAIKLK